MSEFNNESEANDELERWNGIYTAFEEMYRALYVSSNDGKKRKAHIDNATFEPLPADATEDMTAGSANATVIHEPQTKWSLLLFLDAMVQIATNVEFTAKYQACVDRRHFNQHTVLRSCVVAALNEEWHRNMSILAEAAMGAEELSSAVKEAAGPLPPTIEGAKEAVEGGGGADMPQTEGSAATATVTATEPAAAAVNATETATATVTTASSVGVPATATATVLAPDNIISSSSSSTSSSSSSSSTSNSSSSAGHLAPLPVDHSYVPTAPALPQALTEALDRASGPNLALAPATATGTREGLPASAVGPPVNTHAVKISVPMTAWRSFHALEAQLGQLCGSSHSSGRHKVGGG